MPNAARWSAVPFKTEDLPAIGLFFKRNYKGHGSYGSVGLFQWKIIDNVHALGVINLVKDDDTIVATTSITPKSLVLNGERRLCAEIGDTYTAASHRRQGMSILVIDEGRRYAVSRGMDLVYSTPNDQSLPGFERKANFKLVPSANVRVLVIPLSLKAKLEQRVHWAIANILDSMFYVGALLFLKARSALVATSESIEVSELKELPDDWDKFVAQAQAQYDFILSRDRHSMARRFIQNPNKYIVLGLRKKESLVGYAVYRYSVDESRNDLVIADYLTLPGEEDCLRSVLKVILNAALKHRASSISLWCAESSANFRVFRRFGFLPRSTVNLICHQSPVAAEVNACRKWHFTMSDTDNI